MDFIDEVKQLSTRVQGLLSHIKTEEATKQSLILPFLHLLGYNIFDPSEVVPEFTADVGTKKGEKVDYAIMVGGKPAILVEAKCVDDNLDSHEAQLFRYFTVTEAKFAVLTNGIVYKFFSDLQETNKMDLDPFLVFNLLDPKEAIVAEVKRFHKENFNAQDLFSVAVNLKYATQIKGVMDREIKEPSERFIRFLLKDVYEGAVTQKVLESFQPIVKKAVSQYYGDLIHDRLQTALQTSIDQQTTAKDEPILANTPAGQDDVSADDGSVGKVHTTDIEMEGYYIVKALLHEAVDPSRITFKDTQTYFGILLDGKVTRWICRLYFNDPKKWISIRDDDRKKPLWVNIESVDHLFVLKESLLKAVDLAVGTKSEAS